MYRLHVNDIYRYLRKLTGDAGWAEDLTQETFFRAFQHLDTYRGEKVRPWLFKVAYHAFIDWHRKQKRRPVQLIDTLPEQADQARSVRNRRHWLGRRRPSCRLFSGGCRKNSDRCCCFMRKSSAMRK